MSINPTSDILLDVARAADPAKSAAATERLARIAADSGGDADFTEILDGVGAPRSASLPALPEPDFAGAKAQASDASSRAETKAYQGIEALLFQNLAENMLPDSPEFFGEEAGAGIWKSMLAEDLGTALSKRVDLGIGAKRMHLGHAAHSSHPDGALSEMRAPTVATAAKQS